MVNVQKFIDKLFMDGEIMTFNARQEILLWLDHVLKSKGGAPIRILYVIILIVRSFKLLQNYILFILSSDKYGNRDFTISKNFLNLLVYLVYFYNIRKLFFFIISNGKLKMCLNNIEIFWD